MTLYIDNTPGLTEYLAYSADGIHLLSYTRPPYGLATLTVVPFLRYQRSAPKKSRVRRNNRGRFHRRFLTQGLAFDGQESALGLGQQQPFLSLSLQFVSPKSFNRSSVARLIAST